MQKGNLRTVFLFILIYWIITGATNTKENRSSYRQLLSLHPVHISFTTIEYNVENQKFRILFKIFVDDFDLILTKKYGKELKLAEGKWENNYLKDINRYILEHFRLIIDGKDKTKSLLKFDSKEVKEQAIWLYYDFTYKAKSDNFNIYNSLLTDLYQDQNNLLIFVYAEEQKALKFDISNVKQELRF